MKATRMELLKTLIGRDKEASIIWHTLPAMHSYKEPRHDDYAVYIALGDGKIKANVSGQVDEYDLHDSLTIVASPKGTSLELKNVGNKGVDFFVLKTH